MNDDLMRSPQDCTLRAFLADNDAATLSRLSPTMRKQAYIGWAKERQAFAIGVVRGLSAKAFGERMDALVREDETVVRMDRAEGLDF